MAVRPAPWWPRFWAWLVDAIIISIVAWIIFRPQPDFGFVHVGSSTLVAFIYWTFLESDGRTSIGKKALGLAPVKLSGAKPSLGDAALSSFGKAVLLPFDLVIGVLARPGKKQRLFNIAGDTTVVRRK